MRQDELAAFVDALANAEQAAAKKIRTAEAESAARLAALEQSLARKYREKLEALERAWDEREEVALREAEAKAAQLHADTDEVIEALQARHTRVQKGLVSWAISEATGDA